MQKNEVKLKPKKVTKLKKTLIYRGQKIEYFLTLKEQKYIRLKLEDTEICVSAPIQAFDWEIEQLIYKNIQKILKIIDYREKNLHYLIEPNGFVKVNSEKIPASFSPESEETKKMSFKIYETQAETVKKMYAKLSLAYFHSFESVVKKYKTIMGLDFKNLTVKFMKGKWGICYPEKSKIVLNIKLLHYPKIALDYVVVHELSHLVHKNHSRDFWKYVEKYMPNYKNISDLLKVNAL